MNITQVGAFDDVVKEVEAIFPIASSLPEATSIRVYEADLSTPAVLGTTQILYSAKKEASVKRVVITSSVAAVVPLASLDQPFTAAQVGDVVEETPDLFSAYIQSKMRANRAVRGLIEKKRPAFNIISITPTFIVGLNELAITTQEIDAGSNAYYLRPIMGRQNDEGTSSSMCHIDDVDFVHVASLDTKPQGNSNFGIDYNYKQELKWDDSLELARKEFPDAVPAGVFPLGGHGDIVHAVFDASETQRVLRIKFKSLVEMGRDIMQHYMEAARNG